MTLLIVTAVPAEADAIGRVRDARVVAGGIGPASAAAATSAALATGRYDLVLSAGIGGGFAPLVPGDVAVATAAVFADLGAETVEGFAPLSALGLPAARTAERYDVDAALAARLAGRTRARTGTIVTVATATGTAATAARLRARHPDAVAEGMEGAGVAAAAALHGVPFAELRAISNTVGPRDRDAWRVGDALASLSRALAEGAGQQ